MGQEYFEILDLLEEQSNALPRLQKIHEIIQQPNFQYVEGPTADFVLGVFLDSAYWLDRELFDESCLYSKERQNLSPSQKTHLKMLDIGVSLMDKGFPVQYNPAKYMRRGPDQFGPYVKTFVEQIHKRHALVNGKTPTVSLIMAQRKNVR